MWTTKGCSSYLRASTRQVIFSSWHKKFLFYTQAKRSWNGIASTFSFLTQVFQITIFTFFFSSFVFDLFCFFLEFHFAIIFLFFIIGARWNENLPRSEYAYGVPPPYKPKPKRLKGWNDGFWQVQIRRIFWCWSFIFQKFCYFDIAAKDLPEETFLNFEFINLLSRGKVCCEKSFKFSARNFVCVVKWKIKNVRCHLENFRKQKVIHSSIHPLSNRIVTHPSSYHHHSRFH